jgi:hypothetical protein
MAANIIRADDGATVYVIGSKSAIARAGPIPGRTPTSVPSKVPRRPKPKLVRVRALTKPSRSAFTLLIAAP